MKEVFISCGAYEGLYCCIQGHVEAGDEVLIVEPFFECYEPMVRAAGGKAVFIPLRPTKCPWDAENWKLDEAELASSFNARTKILLISTPTNPLGKVFSREELQTIAELCIKWNVLCISDEVYEWLVIPPSKHVRICTLPGMWERTLTIGSAGKAFGVTGWKTGWTYGPSNLMRNVYIVHRNCMYSHCTPIQEAIARLIEETTSLLGTPDCFFSKYPAMIERKRDYAMRVFKRVDLKVVKPHGAYFLLADYTATLHRCNLEEENDTYKDFRYTKWMVKHAGVQFLPATAFFSNKNKKLGENFVRACIMKV